MPDSHDSRCAFTFRDARRCRMLRARHHASLCPFHAARESAPAPVPRPAVIDRMNTRTLDHPWAVRRTVRDLYRLVANEAIPLERAAILARIAELLLVSTRRKSRRRSRVRSSPGHSARPANSKGAAARVC